MKTYSLLPSSENVECRSALKMLQQYSNINENEQQLNNRINDNNIQNNEQMILRSSDIKYSWLHEKYSENDILRRVIGIDIGAITIDDGSDRNKTQLAIRQLQNEKESISETLNELSLEIKTYTKNLKKYNHTPNQESKSLELIGDITERMSRKLLGITSRSGISKASIEFSQIMLSSGLTKTYKRLGRYRIVYIFY